VKSDKQLNIVVCMGSACFARGNNKNLAYLEKLQKENVLDINLELCGNRCENKCAIGPNIIINGKTYNKVTLKDLEYIISEYITIKK
jgi:NADH:ubiquinone oxidoreductase subunit E